MDASPTRRLAMDNMVVVQSYSCEGWRRRVEGNHGVGDALRTCFCSDG